MPCYPHDEVDVEVLEEDLVQESCLDAGVGVVLFSDELGVEAQDPSKAGDGASCPVFSLVAVHEDGVVGAIHDEAKSS